MSQCMECGNWNLRATAPEMARMGFAQCSKRQAGHMTSAQAAGCDRFVALADAERQARGKWLAKHGLTMPKAKE